MGMLNELSTERDCVCAPPFTLMKTLPSGIPCAPARDPRARVNPISRRLMRVVVFIDLLVSVVEWSSAPPIFSRAPGDGNTDEMQLFRLQRRSIRLQYLAIHRRLGIAPYLEQLNETKKPGSVWCVRACRLRARVQLS